MDQAPQLRNVIKMREQFQSITYQILFITEKAFLRLLRRGRWISDLFQAEAELSV